jgi:glutathione S-transferase
MATPKLELISFHLCPFVQRSIITLKHKNVDFTLKEIDLENPPEWFQKISPLGKVPVLVVDGQTTLFESAVINEYIDEITEPRLMLSDPLAKAKERAWIEYGSSLLMEMYGLAHEENAEAFQTNLTELFDSISKLEPILSGGAFFRGKDFSLVDTSYAPFFLRMSYVPTLWNHSAWSKMPKTRQWAESLIANKAVQASAPSDLKSGYVGYIQETSSFLFANQ